MEKTSEKKVTVTQPEQAAWGGIGGSGKHAADALAEIARNPDVLAQVARTPELAELMQKLPQKAWGGIGGSGKHADEIEPEIVGTRK